MVFIPLVSARFQTQEVPVREALVRLKTRVRRAAQSPWIGCPSTPRNPSATRSRTPPGVQATFLCRDRGVASLTPGSFL